MKQIPVKQRFKRQIYGLFSAVVSLMAFAVPVYADIIPEDIILEEKGVPVVLIIAVILVIAALTVFLIKRGKGKPKR